MQVEKAYIVTDPGYLGDMGVVNILSFGIRWTKFRFLKHCEAFMCLTKSTHPLQRSVGSLGKRDSSAN